MLAVRSDIGEYDPLRLKVFSERKVNSKKIVTDDVLKTSFDDIEFGKPLKEIPKKFISDALNFTGYISETAKKTFRIKGYKYSTGEYTDKEIPYVHRWTSIYRKSILAKMYQLEDYLGVNLSDICMITLTTYQKHKDPEDCLLTLKRFYTRLIDVMRKEFGTNDYFYVLEPHKTGYVHMHLLYMRVLSEFEKNKLINLWAGKYGAGSADHGINFTDIRSSVNGFFKSGSVSRIRGYLMKYLSKGLTESSIVSNKYGKLKMEPNEVLFNALLKKHKIRLWNCSRNFSEVMRRPDSQKSDWECTEVSQYYNGELQNIIWSKDSGIRPDVVKVLKYLYSLPLLTRYDEKLIKQRKIVSQYNDKKKRFDIFEVVWVPVDTL